MDNHIHCLLQTINTLILFSLLASTAALAQDDNSAGTFLAGEQFTPATMALQNPSDKNCYEGNRNARFMVRIKDISALWHYAVRVLRPTAAASASAAPHDGGARPIKTDKGVVMRVGTVSNGVLVSASLPW